MRFLVTRPQPQAEETAGLLRAMGHEAIIFPLMHARPLPMPDIDPASAGLLVFSSSRAAAYLCEHALWQALKDCPIMSVGAKAAERLRHAGGVNIEAVGDRVDALIEPIIRYARTSHAFGGKSVIYFAGSERSGNLEGQLAQANISCRLAEIYQMIASKLPPQTIIKDWKAGRFDAVLLYSQRSAERFAKMLQQENLMLSLVKIFALSAQAAGPFAEHPQLIMPPRPNEAALMQAISAHSQPRASTGP